MTPGPVLPMLLEGDGAITPYCVLMGVTKQGDAAEGTIRKDFREAVTRNAVHGSDSLQSAAREISFFFKDEEIVG